MINFKTRLSAKQTNEYIEWNHFNMNLRSVTVKTDFSKVLLKTDVFEILDKKVIFEEYKVNLFHNYSLPWFSWESL